MNFSKRRRSIQRRRFSIQKQRRRLSRWLIYATPLLIFTITLLVGYLLVYKYEYFNIRNVEVLGAESFVNETDLKELAKPQAYEKNLLSYDVTRLESSLEEIFQGAKNISISKKFPDTIKIHVFERTPIAVVYNEVFPKQYLVDGDGYVLGEIAEGTTNLPKIFYEEEISVGLFLDPDLIGEYFALINALDTEKIAASSISVYSDYLQIYLEDSVEAFFGKTKDKYKATKVLKALLEQLKTEGKNPKVVDLRYDKVVVSYK